MKDYNDYINYTRKIYDIYMSMSVLHWDMETHMLKMVINSLSTIINTSADCV